MKSIKLRFLVYCAVGLAWLFIVYCCSTFTYRDSRREYYYLSDKQLVRQIEKAILSNDYYAAARISHYYAYICKDHVAGQKWSAISGLITAKDFLDGRQTAHIYDLVVTNGGIVWTGKIK
jgi:hypothetical protein